MKEKNISFCNAISEMKAGAIVTRTKTTT